MSEALARLEARLLVVEKRQIEHGERLDALVEAANETGLKADALWADWKAKRREG